MLRFTDWIPNPPSLQKAIDAGHVATSVGKNGRVYVVSRQCPDRDLAIRAIEFRKSTELLCACLVGVIVGSSAVIALSELGFRMAKLESGISEREPGEAGPVTSVDAAPPHPGTPSKT